MCIQILMNSHGQVKTNYLRMHIKSFRRKKAICIFSLIFVFSFLGGTLRAEEGKPAKGQVSPAHDDSQYPDTFRVEEVVVLSEHIRKSRVIIPGQVITPAQLAPFSPATLTDALNQLPGVYIQSGAINTNRITIRGIGSRTLYGTNKIRAYFNGIPVTSGTGETSIDVYDPEDMESIELIKGPKATAFGTNLGGTILMNSPVPRPGERTLKSSFTLGSFGLFKNSTTGGYADERVSLHMQVHHLQTDGFRENSAYNRNGWLLSAAVNADRQSVISVFVRHSNYFARIASSIGRTAFEEDPSQAAANWKAARGYEDDSQTLAALSYSRSYTKGFKNTTSFFVSTGDHYEPRPFNILSENTDGYGVRTVFSKTLALGAGTSEFHFGGEWYADQYNWETNENLYRQNDGKGSLEGELISRNREFRDYFNVFVSWQVPLTENLHAQAGLNLNKTAYDYRDRINPGPDGKSADRSFDPVLAPNLSLRWRFRPGQFLYGNLSNGFNYPGLEETLTPEGVLNPEIDPERGWNYELGSRMAFFDDRLQLDLAAYLMRIRGLLVARRTGEDEYIGMNAGKTRHRGIELALNYHMPFSGGLSVDPYLQASFNFHEFVNFVDGENDYSGNELTGVPGERISAGVRITHQSGLSLYPVFEHTGKIPMNDANSLYSEPYSLLHLKAVYAKNITRRFSVEASAGLNNLTDEKYASSVLINATGVGGAEPRYYYPGMPRNWYGGMKLRYSF